MSFLAAIPVIGSLFESIGGAVDKLVTSDHERLQMKATLMQLQVPVIIAVLEAQKATNELQVKLAEIEGKSEHWLVWSRRPIIAFLAVGNFIGSAIFGYMNTDNAFYFACLANGLDIAGRSTEKVVTALKGKERL